MRLIAAKPRNKQPEQLFLTRGRALIAEAGNTREKSDSNTNKTQLATQLVG
jgi:hypothetical protein